MHTKQFIILMMTVALLLFVIGCSDDSTSSQKQVGELTDTSYLQVESTIESMDEFTSEMFESMFWLIDTVMSTMSQSPGKLTSKYSNMRALSDSVLLAYHTNSQYWYFYVSVNDTLGTGEQMIVTSSIIQDSIQFLHGTTAVQWPDSLQLTGINTGADLDLAMTSPEISLNVAANQKFNIVGDILTDGTITINGNNGISLSALSISEGCNSTMAITGEAVDIVTTIDDLDDDDGNDDCPTSGSLTHNGTISLACTGESILSFSDTWFISQTFNSTGVDIVVENSTTRWTTTELCGETSLKPLW